MNGNEPPPLPEARWLWREGDRPYEDSFSADQMQAYARAYALEAVRAEREACAREIERTYGINAAVIRARGKP